MTIDGMNLQTLSDIDLMHDLTLTARNLAIRAAQSSGFPLQDIAIAAGVSRQTVHNILAAPQDSEAIPESLDTRFGAVWIVQGDRLTALHPVPAVATLSVEEVPELPDWKATLDVRTLGFADLPQGHLSRVSQCWSVPPDSDSLFEWRRAQLEEAGYTVSWQGDLFNMDFDQGSGHHVVASMPVVVTPGQVVGQVKVISEPVR